MRSNLASTASKPAYPRADDKPRFPSFAIVARGLLPAENALCAQSQLGLLALTFVLDELLFTARDDHAISADG